MGLCLFANRQAHLITSVLSEQSQQTSLHVQRSASFLPAHSRRWQKSGKSIFYPFDLHDHDADLVGEGGMGEGRDRSVVPCGDAEVRPIWFSSRPEQSSEGTDD